LSVVGCQWAGDRCQVGHFHAVNIRVPQLTMGINLDWKIHAGETYE